MENINSNDLPDSLKEVINTLTKVKQEILESRVTLLMDGELKQAPNTSLGETYPYDFELYAKESLDTNVQVLSRLISNLDKALRHIREANKIVGV